MKLIIDIDEDSFLSCKHWLKEGVAQWSEAIIANGTPLPKGHGDLIDRKKLGITPIDSTDLPIKGCLMVYLAEDVDGAPAIIEADMRGEE